MAARTRGARRWRSREPATLVLGVDTSSRSTADPRQARRRRSRPRTTCAALAGRTHEVVGGVALVATAVEHDAVEVTEVDVRSPRPDDARLVRGDGGVARARRRLRDPGPRRSAGRRDRGRLPQRRRAPAVAPPEPAPRPASGHPDFQGFRGRAFGRLARRAATLTGARATARARRVPPHGLLQLPHRLRWPRHGGRPRHRQHARLRARPRHRAVRAERGGDRLAHRRGPRGRHRGQAHARPHARHDPAPSGR